MRFALLFLAVTLLAFPVMAGRVTSATTIYALTDEDKASLARVETYLSNIRTVSAEFTQAAPDGSISSGKFYLMRPGKLRMEYDPPTPVLMVASGHDIVYYDKELDQITHIPLESTLISFLARDKIKFDETVTITNVEHGNNSLRVSLIQAKRPKDGTLTLEFADKPLTLRNMIVTDGGGATTTVSLNNARFDAPLASELFVFKDPHPDRRNSIRK